MDYKLTYRLTEDLMKVTNAWLTVNRECNNRCEWCYAQSTGFEKSNMSFGLAEQIVTFMGNVGIKRCVIIGGEPTLYSNIVKVLGLIKDNGIDSHIVTNGRRFEDKVFCNEICHDFSRLPNPNVFWFNFKKMKFLLHYTLKNEIQYAEIIASRLNWYVMNGYKVKLPEGIGIDSKKSEISKSVVNDFCISKEIFRGVKLKVKNILKDNQSAIDNFFSFFDYEVPEKIDVYFTMYGPGGSYCPPSEIIVVLKDDPIWIAQTIIHETIHNIIEGPFIKKFNVSHWEKEFVVDSLCKSDILKAVCADYKTQPQSKKPSQDIIEKLKFEEKHFINYENEK